MYDAGELTVEQIGAVLGWPHLDLSGAGHDDAAGPSAVTEPARVEPAVDHDVGRRGDSNADGSASDLSRRGAGSDAPAGPPIGLDIGSRTPVEIALSTMAGLLADRNGRPGGAYPVA